MQKVNGEMRVRDRCGRERERDVVLGEDCVYV